MQRPNLVPLALNMLSAPASSACVEHIFSLSGMLTAERQNHLKKTWNYESFYKTEEAYFVDVSCTDSKVNTGDNEN